MTMFQKPTVDIAFSPNAEIAEQVVETPREEWASTPARRVALAVLLMLLCIFTFIYPAFKSSFLPGDDTTVKSNPVFFYATGLRTIWGSPQRMPQLTPLSYSVMLIEHEFFAARPRGYHVISICFHAGNVLLLWLLLRRLELPGAWFAAALFAVHPVQVDAVSWISQQRYLICGLFYLGALLVYLRRLGMNPAPLPPLPGAEPLIQLKLPENPKALYAISYSLFLLAVLSHIEGATLPLVLLILIWWERGRLKRSDATPLIPFAAVSLGVWIVSAAFAFHRTGKLWFSYPGNLNWIVIWGHGVWTYFLETLLPIRLSFAYSRWTADTVRAWQWILPVATVFLLAALWKLRRRWGRGPITSAMLFICLLLPSALGASDPGDAELAGVMVRDHVLYLACAAVLVPLAAVVADALDRLKANAKLAASPDLFAAIAASIAVAVVGPLAIFTALHTESYNDETSLWQNVLRVDSESTVALNTLGQLEMADKAYSNAEQHFLAALRASPADTQAQMNLARVAEAQKQYDVAIERYYEVLAHEPDHVDAHFGLGEVLAAEGDTSDALREYARVEQLDPRDALVYNNVGLIDAQVGRLDQAEEEYRKAISIDPRSLPAYLNLANTQFQQRKYPGARDTLQKALQIDPTSYVAWLNAGVMAEAVGDLRSAEQYFRYAIYYKYDSADAFSDLGMVLMREGDPPGKMDRLSEAIYYLKRASELDPSNTAVLNALNAAKDKKENILREQQQ